MKNKMSGKKKSFHGKTHAKSSRKKIFEGRKEHREKLSTEIKLKKNKEMRKNLNNSPNSKEISILSILRKHSYFKKEWKFTGDPTKKKNYIGTKCPDFTIRKKKLIIEHLSSYWHDTASKSKITPSRFHKIKEQRNKIDYFEKFGYKTLIIWQEELKDEKKLIKKIKKFEKTNRDR